MDNMKVEPGQVWETEISSGRIGKVVIVATQPNFANTLAIWDADIPQNFQLSCGGNVDTRRLVYTNYDNLRCMIDYVSGAELELIKARISDAIGLHSSGGATDPTELPESGNLRLIIAERERDIWKSVAMNLMKYGGTK